MGDAVAKAAANAGWNSRGAGHCWPQPYGERGEPLYWFDVLIDFTFEQGRFPDGTIELYWSRGSQGWVENYVGAVSSTVRTFRHVRAFSDFENDDVSYRMRYRSGR